MTTRTALCVLLFMAGAAPGQAANSKGALSPVEQTAAINSVRQYVLGSMKSLPNYAGTLTVRHTTRPPNAVNDPTIQSNVVEEHVSAVDGKETVTETASMLPHDFGSLPGIIFDPATGADLRWDRTTTLEHRKVDVLAFHVPASTGYPLAGNGTSVQVPFEGFVYADTQTHAVVKLRMKCTMTPNDTPIRTFDLTLDYKPAQLGGRELILPSHFLLQVMDSVQDRQIIDDGRYSAWRPFTPAAQ